MHFLLFHTIFSLLHSFPHSLPLLSLSLSLPPSYLSIYLSIFLFLSLSPHLSFSLPPSFSRFFSLLQGKLYLVFEHVDRTILEDLEKNPDGLDPSHVKKIMWQLIRSIEFCHAHNVIHRDIKPENLLISKNGILKVCIFLGCTSSIVCFALFANH